MKEETGANGAQAAEQRPVPKGTKGVKESFFARFGAPFYVLPPPPPKERKIYRFNSEDNDENIVFTKDEDGRLQVKGGTVEKLVERITHPSATDPATVAAFLLTYRSFVTPAELFDCLMQRFNSEPPASVKDLEEWKKTEQTVVRLRVFSALKMWISTYFYDFAEDPKLVQDLQEFIIKDMAPAGMEKAVDSLQKILQRKTSGKDAERDVVFTKPPPRPYLPTNLTGALSLGDLNPEEIARQLTLIEYDLFKAIKPWECLGQAWTKKDKEKKAPNILAMISRFNFVSRWVATEVVKGETAKDRCNTLRIMLDIAEKCKALNNFNAMMEIISGLQASSIYRLKQTWALLPTRSKNLFEEITTLMSSEANFKVFRQHLHAIDPPCIPYLGVYLTDLTFIEDGNTDFLAGGLINFVKRRKLSHVIREIHQYQQTPYCLEPVPFIQDFLLQTECWEVEECYKTSLLREQRQDGSAPPQTKLQQLQKTKSHYRIGPSSTRTPETSRREVKDDEGTPRRLESEADAADDYGEMEVIEGYRFTEKDSEENLTFSKENATEIRGGTLAKLVERLTHDKHPDTNFMINFLMTFPTFSTPEEFLDLLVMRFNPPKPLSTAKEVQDKFKKRIIPIHFRVFNVLKNWVEKFYEQDFREKPELVDKLAKFTDTDLKASMEKAAEQLQKALQKKMEGVTESEWKPLLAITPGTPSSQFLRIPPEQIAAALTQAHLEIYLAIKPREVLKRAWLSEDKAIKAPGITALKEESSKLSQWVLTEVLRESNTKRRANVLAYFIQVAERCLDLMNIETASSLVDGVGGLPIQLCNIWEWISSGAQRSYKRVAGVVRNSRVAMEFLADKPKPWLLNLDDTLKEIVEIEESNPDFLEGSTGAPLINFEKRRLVAEKFVAAQTYARPPHTNPKAQAPPEVFEYLKQVNLIDPVAARKAIDQIGEEEVDPFSLSHNLNPGEFNDVEVREAELGVANRAALLSRLIDSSAIPAVNDATIFADLKSAVERDTGKPNGGISGDIFDKAIAALREEALDYSRNFLDEVTVARYFAGLAPKEAYHQAAKNIARRVFSSGAIRHGSLLSTPGASSAISDWSYNDEKGELYGWPESLSYLVVEREGKKVLVDVQANTDKAEVSSAFRAFTLFSRLNPGASCGVAIVTSDVSQEARTFAAKHDVEIFLSR